MAVGAAAGLFAVIGGSRFGRHVRKERGLPEFKTGADPARLGRERVKRVWPLGDSCVARNSRLTTALPGPGCCVFGLW